MSCRVCGERTVERFLDLGVQPHCNRLSLPGSAADSEPRYPLRAGFCHNCSLVQIDHTIPKERMFSEYPYVSGTTRTLIEHFRNSADRLVSAYGLGPDSLVVDIGSNDGSWLAQYRPHGVRVLGVEAASNVAEIAVAAGVPTLNRFFNAETAELIRREHGAVALITAAGVFFHLEELHSVVDGIGRLIGDDGVFVVQAIYLGGMIENLAFDQIYHEHLCYYTLRSLEELLGRHGLAVFDVHILPIHGGSIEAHVARIGTRAVQPAVGALRAEEAAKGLGRIETYRAFADHVWQQRTRLLGVLEDYRRRGLTVYAYGAPAKGATLLNSFGIDRRLVAKAVEKNRMKVGLVMPGSQIPIVGEETERPDAYLLLAWNFLSEFLAKEAAYLESGGAFIVPIPRVEIIGRDALGKAS
ncbi:MAG: methyltransferase domain-containing protein [Azospirillum sp.]|nr:methyltransferase domain-containing protein [Azospirillum sp.]